MIMVIVSEGVAFGRDKISFLLTKLLPILPTHRKVIHLSVITIFEQGRNIHKLSTLLAPWFRVFRFLVLWDIVVCH